jgi:hypothetical protein
MLYSCQGKETDEPYPEGYLEALQQCKILAADLLQRAVAYNAQNRCWDCASWIGRCTKGKIWRIARDEACSEFSQPQGKR